MVVEPLAPPVAWIWWTHAAWGVGGLVHVCSYAAIEAIKWILYIEVEIKCFLSRREALIVLLEEDFWDKTSYDFTSLKKHEFLASQRFELTNKEKRDLDTPQKVHPKNPCNYYNTWI